MADVESTVGVTADTGGAQTEIKGLSSIFGKMFGDVGAAAELGGGSISNFFRSVGKSGGDLKSGILSLGDSTLSLRDRFSLFGMGAKDAFSGAQASSKTLVSELGALGSMFTSNVGPAVKSLAVGLTAVGATAALIFTPIIIGLTAVGFGLYKITSGFADAGDKLFTLSKQTGQSAQALSTYQYIGEQTGASLDSIANATFKMSINIAKGGKTIEQAFHGIGTSTKELRDLSPEEQFAKIMKGLGDIPDAGQRALVGVQIFGKGFKEIAQLADEDLVALTANAKTFGLVMSDEMAAAGDRFGDTLGDMSSILTGLKNIIGSFLLPIVNSFIGTVRDEMVVALGMLRDTFGPLFSGASKFGDGLSDASESAEFHTTVLKFLIMISAGLIDAFAALVRAAGFVIGVYYDIRTAGNLLLVTFGKIVEGVLWSAQQIAIGMSKISFGDVKASFQRDADEIGAKLGQVRKDIKGLGDSSAELQAKKESLTTALGGFADKLSIGADELRKHAAAYTGVQTAVDSTRPKLHGLSDDLDGIGDSAKDAKEKVNEFAQTSTKQIADLLAAWNAQPAAIKGNSESINILLDKYMRLRSGVMDRSKLPNELEGLAFAFGRLTPAIATSADGLEKLVKSLPSIKVDLPFIIPTIQTLSIDLDKVGTKTYDWGQSMVDAMNKAARLKEEARAAAIDGLDKMAASLAAVSQIAPGAIGSVTSALGVVVGGIGGAMHAFDGMKSGISALGKGNTLQGLGSLAGGISTVISLAGTAYAVLKKLFGAEGRKDVKEFAESEGGFDALHAKLLKLGEAGEKLWIKLTQGVGRNNPQQAQAVIAEVSAALADQADKQDAVTDATEDSALATIETATEASAALDTVSAKLKTNAEDWDYWSATVVELIKRVGSEVNAISVGHSPGGIKEWKPMLRDAVGSFAAFSDSTVANLRRVSREVNAFGSLGANGPIDASGGSAMLAGAGGVVTIAAGAIQIDRPILKDRESMQELTQEVMKQLQPVLAGLGAWR